MATELDCSIGISAAETTYGTPATVSKFFEFTEDALEWNPTFQQGAGLRVGSLLPRSARRVLGRQMSGGSFTVEAPSKGLGAILMAAFGSVVSTQRGTTGVYQHNFTLAGDPAPSYTLQKGLPPVGGGSALPMTYPGAVCSSLQIACQNSDIVSVQPTFNARELRTDIAYAAPSYATNPFEILRFTGASIFIASSGLTAPTTTALGSGTTALASIRDFTMTLDRNIDDNGFNMGGAGKRSRKPAYGLAALTGSVTAELIDSSLRDAYLNQVDMGMLLTFQGTTIIGTGTDVPALSLYIPNVRFEGDVPNANGGDVITQSIGFTAFDNLSAAPITASYVTTDTTP